MSYKAKARPLGANYISNEVVEIFTGGPGVTGVRLASGEVLSTGLVTFNSSLFLHSTL